MLYLCSSNIFFMKILNLLKKTYPILIIFIAIFAQLTFSFSSCRKDQEWIPEKGYIVDTLIIADPITGETFVAIDSSEINFPELVITDFNGGDVEWVSIQENSTPDSKVADAKQDRNDIKRDGSTLYIQLYNIVSGDEELTPFTKSGGFIIVLKHRDSNKMFIKGVPVGKPEFKDGCVQVKWGGWFEWAS